MAIISTYSVPGPNAALTESKEYSTVDELLQQLIDNNNNLINANHIRDAVYTLWERVDYVQNFASQSAGSASVLYTNATPTPVAIGGIGKGSTFSAETMEYMWNALLYPYIAPGRSISVNGSTWTTLGVPNTKEFGDPDNNVPLAWSVTKNSKTITNISVDGVVVGTVNGGNQSDTKPSNPLGMSTATLNVGGTFQIVVSDDGGSTSHNSSVSVGYLNPVYYGRWPNKTSIPTFSGWNGSAPNYLPEKPAWADGAGIGTGKKLASSFTGVYNGINGAGQHVVFAFPSSYGIPKFFENNLANSAWIKIGKGVNFVNRFGMTILYDIWISDTQYPSSVNPFRVEVGQASDYPAGWL
jgi:hypothetical protein